jgi:hypothetical protein
LHPVATSVDSGICFHEQPIKSSGVLALRVLKIVPNAADIIGLLRYRYHQGVGRLTHLEERSFAPAGAAAFLRSSFSVLTLSGVSETGNLALPWHHSSGRIWILLATIAK